MGVYKPKGNKYFKYDFEFNGERYNHSTGETQKHKALLVEARKKEELLNGPSSKDISVIDGLYKFRDSRARNKKSLKNLSNAIKKITGDSLGGSKFHLDPRMKFNQLTTAKVTEYRLARVSEGLKPNSIRLELSILQATYRLLKDAGYSVSGDIKFNKPKASRKLRYLTFEEQDALVKAMMPQNKFQHCKVKDLDKLPDHALQGAWDNHDLVILLLDSGARVMEISKAMWSGFNDQQRYLEYAQWKTGTVKRFYLTQRSYEVLKRRLKSKKYEKEIYIFPGKLPGTPRSYNREGITKVIDRLGFNSPELVERFGKCTIHSLRHSYATGVVSMGLPKEDLQNNLGHADVGTSEIYLHLTQHGPSLRAAKILDSRHSASKGEQNSIDHKTA